MYDSIDSYQPLFQSNESDELISPKQFEITTIPKDRAVACNKLWHSRLPKITNAQGGLYFGAIWNNKIYAVAIWTMPIAANRLKDGFNILELRRMAINDKSPRNTASYMISKMVKLIRKLKPNITKLISYQDTEVHHGTIYKCSNWKVGAVSKLNNWQNRKRNVAQTESVKIRWEYDLL